MVWKESASGSTPRTDRAPGAVEPPLPGERMAQQIEDAVESSVDRDADLESNELHAGGQTCFRCGRVIRPSQDVRRTVTGAYQHEVCPR